jgi:16S rRNA (cytidine1402-2'-O)-methyltransferase
LASGTLFVVATPIGNLEDITVRALRVLREVAVIAAEDTRRTAHLLARHAISTKTTSLHEHNEARKASSLVERLLAGESIALVSDAGTPTVSDPGGRLIAAAIEAGVKIEPLPGPSAVLAALAASGLPSDTFTFLGFPPTRSNDRKLWFEQLAKVGGTVVFFESPHRIRATLEDLTRVAGDCRVAVCRELTKVHEQLVRGPISVVLKLLAEDRGEFTVVADVGQLPHSAPRPVSDSDLLTQFGDLTANGKLTRRQALTQLSRRHRLPPNQVYTLIERAKKSGERPT